MGLLSKLLRKKNTSQNNSTVNITFTVIDSFGDNPPALQGDYAKSIFLWAHNKVSPIRQKDSCPNYFLYECGIRDASKYHMQLIEEGYFEPASPAAALDALKVADLKQILSKLNQPVSGKKIMLIERILATADQAELDSICNKLYMPSQKGRAFLHEHNNYVLIHKHRNWCIDWHEFDVHHKPGYSFYDTVWGILSERASHDTYNFGRNEIFCMYQLLLEEGKRERALEMLLRVLYIDLSGARVFHMLTQYKKGLLSKDYLKDSFRIAIMLAPGIIQPLVENKDIYSDDIIDQLYLQKLPVQICTKAMFRNIVHSILDGTFEENVVEEKLQKAYVRFIDQI